MSLELAGEKGSKEKESAQRNSHLCLSQVQLLRGRRGWRDCWKDCGDPGSLGLFFFQRQERTEHVCALIGL